MNDIVKTGRDYITFIFASPVCWERPVNDNEKVKT